MKSRQHFPRLPRNIITLFPSFMLVGSLISGCGQEPAPEPKIQLVPVVQVANSQDMAARDFPGRARAGQEVNLSFRVTGPLIEFPVSVGDEVAADDVVARIDPQDYLNAMGTAKGALEAAQATAKKAEADYTRIQNVFKEDPGATSETAIDLTRAARDSARATVNSLRSAFEASQDQVAYTTLEAPFDGVVVETYVENFETVIAKEPVLRLLDPSSIEFIISVPENQISYAPYVDNVTVTFDALEGITVPATIKEIGKEASRATRTYPVTLVMEQPEGAQILPGMAGTARVSVTLPEGEGEAEVGHQLPITAIFTRDDPEKSFVWVVDDADTLQLREVETGSLSRFGIVIKSGVQSGEWVVTKGVHSVSEGQQVKKMDLTAEGDAS